MKQKYFFILLILIGVVSGIYNLYSAKQSKQEVVVEEVKQVLNVSYTIEDIKMHSSKTDCWQVIDGVVYNFTPYLSSTNHPGGNAMAKDCGTDATFRYENDPEHSEEAKAMLPEYRIGKLIDPN